MNLRFFIKSFLILSIGLNLPGLLALAAHAARPLEIAALFFLPLIALWGLPGVLFLEAHRNLFEVTEFGVYPQAPSGWMLVFASWVVLALVLSALTTAIRFFKNSNDAP